MRISILGIIVLAISAPLHAAPMNAPIGWTDGTFTTDAVLPTHNVLYAVGFGDGSSVTTANGVTFGADNQTNVTYSPGTNFGGYLSGGGTTGDSNFDTVLTNGDYGSNGTLTLNHLNIGTTYEVQLLVDDTRGAFSGRTGSVSDGTNSSTTIQFAFGGGTPAIGTYYDGLFVADAATEVIDVNNQGGNQIDGLVLASVPEPSSLVALFGVGAMGLFVVARRRRRKA